MCVETGSNGYKIHTEPSGRVFVIKSLTFEARFEPCDNHVDNYVRARGNNIEEEKTLKPFNLKDALAGKPVVTRSGLKVLRIFETPELTEFHKVQAVVDEPGKPQLLTYSVNGLFSDQSWSRNLDLFMAAEKKSGWANIYPSRRTFIYQTKNDADIAMDDDRIACVRIEWEE